MKPNAERDAAIGRARVVYGDGRYSLDQAAQLLADARAAIKELEPLYVASGREVGVPWWDLANAIGVRPEVLRRRYVGR